MKMLLNICKNTHLTEKKYEYLFLLLNTLAFKGTEWMFTFVGYFGLIPGFIGGVVEVWRNER